MNITVSQEFITPQQAGVILSQHNAGNRRLRRWASEAMAAAMFRGEWITTHQGIAFTQSGRLLDGQHRLLAVQRFGRPVEFLVFRGVPDEAFKVIDIGIKRRCEDITGLPKRTAEATRYASVIACGAAPSADQILLVADSGFAEVHDKLIEFCGTTRATVSAAPVRAAAVALVMDGHAESAVFDLYRQLVLAPQDCAASVYALLRQIADRKVTGSKSTELFSRALKALNPANQALSKIQIGEADLSAAMAFLRTVIKRAVAAEKGVSLSPDAPRSLQSTPAEGAHA